MVRFAHRTERIIIRELSLDRQRLANGMGASRPGPEAKSSFPALASGPSMSPLLHTGHRLLVGEDTTAVLGAISLRFRRGLEGDQSGQAAVVLAL